MGVTEIPYHHGIRKVDTLLIFAKNSNLLGKKYLYYSYYFAIHSTGVASFYYIFSLSGEGKKALITQGANKCADRQMHFLCFFAPANEQFGYDFKTQSSDF